MIEGLDVEKIIAARDLIMGNEPPDVPRYYVAGDGCIYRCYKGLADKIELDYIGDIDDD